jgi:hypothetical protein
MIPVTEFQYEELQLANSNTELQVSDSLVLSYHEHFYSFRLRRKTPG